MTLDIPTLGIVQGLPTNELAVRAVTLDGVEILDALHHADTWSIDPGCPWQNAFGESFNGSLRDECLNMSAFASVAEACILLESFPRQY
jgi:hypothetical protein